MAVNITNPGGNLNSVPSYVQQALATNYINGKRS